MEMLGAIQEMNCLICEADIKFPSPKRARIDSCGKETINKHEIQQCFEGNGELHDVIEKGKEDRNIANTELSSHEFIPPSRSHIFSDTEECSKITLDKNENNPSYTKETNYQTTFSSLSTVGKNPNSFWNNQFLTSDLHGALEAKEGLHIITDNDKPKEVNIKEELEINKQCANNKAYITYQSYNENKITDVLNSIVDDLHTQNILNYTASDYTANVPKSSLESEEKSKDGKETKANYSADGNAKTLESVTENCMTNRIIPSQERKKTEMKNNKKITAVYATSEKANTKSILLVSSIDPHIERDGRAEAYYSFSSDNIGMETAECDVPFGIVLSQNIHVNETHEETKTRHDILSTYKEESDIHGAVCESQVECFKNSGSDVLGVIALEYVDYKENHIEKYKDEQVRSNVTELCKTKSDSRNKSGESHNYSASVQLEIESAVNNDARISGKIHFETQSLGLGSKIACGSTENCGIHEKELGIISLDHLSKLKIDCRHGKEKKEIHSGQQFINVALSQIQTEKMAVTKMDDMHNQSPSSNWKEEQYLNVNPAEQAAVSSKTMIEKENGVLLCGSSEMLPKNVKLHFQYKGDDSNHTTETESFLFINKNRQEISKPYPLQDFQDSCGIVYGKPHSGQSYQNITRMSTNYVEVHLSDESVNTWNADLNLNAQPLLHIKETQSEKLDVKLITENLLNRESDQSCSKLRHFLIQNRNGNDEEIELASQDVMHVNSTVNNQHENAIYFLDCLPEDTSQRLLTFKCNEDVIDSDNLSGTHLYYSDTTFHEETVTTYRILKNAEQDVKEELMFDKDLDVRTNYSVMGPDAKDTKEKMYGSSQNGICEIDMVTPNYNYALISQIQEHNYIQKVVNTGKTEDEVLSPVSENSSRITGIVDDKQQSIACRTQSRFPPDIFTVPVFDTFEKIPLCLGNEEVENISLNNFPHNPATINTRKKCSLYSQTNATSSETHNNLLPVNVSKCKSKFDFSKQHSETGQISALEQSEDGYVNYSQKTGNGQTHDSMCSVCTKNFNTDEESSQNSPCQMPETETTEVLQTSEMDLDRSESMIQSVDSKATPSMYPLNLNVEMPKFEMKTQFDLVLEELSLFFEISKETEQPCSSTTTTETFFTQNLLFEKQESPCYVDCYSNSTFKHVSTLQNPGVSTVQPSEEMTQVRETTGEQEVPSHCSSSESEKEESLYSSFKNKDYKETGDKQNKQWSPAFLFCSLPHGKEQNVLGISGLHGSAGIVRLEPLKTCTGPIRLGLSKRVRPKQLHPYLK